MDGSYDTISVLVRLFGSGMQSVATLWTVALGGLLLAAAGWATAVYHARLWNRAYRLRRWQHALCGAAAVVTLVSVPMWAATGFVMNLVDVVDRDGQRLLTIDADWQQQAFARASEAVQQLGGGRLAGIPAPGEPETSLPLADSTAIQAVAAVYATSAAEYLGERHPQLRPVIERARRAESDVVHVLLRNTIEQQGGLRPLDQAVTGAAWQLVGAWLDYVRAWIWKTRLAVASLFLLAQSLAFGLIGFCAYRDIKVHL